MIWFQWINQPSKLLHLSCVLAKSSKTDHQVYFIRTGWEVTKYAYEHSEHSVPPNLSLFPNICYLLGWFGSYKSVTYFISHLIHLLCTAHISFLFLCHSEWHRLQHTWNTVGQPVLQYNFIVQMILWRIFHPGKLGLSHWGRPTACATESVHSELWELSVSARQGVLCHCVSCHSHCTPPLPPSFSPSLF